MLDSVDPADEEQMEVWVRSPSEVEGGNKGGDVGEGFCEGSMCERD